MVPRSFSPAMDSGATAMQPLKRKMSNSIGMREENSIPVASSWVTKSYSPERLISNRLDRLLSYWSNVSSMRLYACWEAVDAEL